MLIRAVAALLIAACSTQANAQAVLDRAVRALGGADVLQKIARASRGAYYPATPDSIQRVLTEVISNF